MDERLKRIEDLVRETFGLWDEMRQGFSWRKYYWNHTIRVRNLAEEIGRREGADLEKLRYAVTLHDITKRYDGQILTDENGRRVVDKNGFWMTELVKPARENIVTKLYHENDLYHTLHNISGAFIAGEILKRHGFDREFIESVKSIIEAHLQPINADESELARLYSQVESQILHDADMMDANLGYVAFFRNINIHTYFAIQRNGRADLREYIMGIPRWINTKESFIDRLMTASAREIGVARQERKRRLWKQLSAELGDFEMNRRFGLIGLIEHFMSFADDPDLPEQMRSVSQNWLPEREKMLSEDGAPAGAREALARVIAFRDLLQREIDGMI